MGILDVPGVSKNLADRRYAKRTVHIVGLWGQSNMSGRGASYSSFTDPAISRIKQFGSGASVITAANEPLDMHDVPSGIGPGLQFARNYLERLPFDDIILLVPSAHGGTALSTNTSPLGWRWGVSGNLSALAVTQMQAAIAKATTDYPDATISLDAILWFQGETDSTTGNMVSFATYQADLDALIAGARTTFGIPNLPFIVYRMIPEALGTGTRDQIDACHQNTPYRVAYTGVVPAISGQSNGDALHANATQHRVNGPIAFAEYLRVRSGRAPVYADVLFTVQVIDLVALSPGTGTSISLSWTASVNATSYLVEYKTSASSTWLTWSSVTPNSALVTGLTTGTPYDFRVTASNISGVAPVSATATATPAPIAPGTTIFADNFNRADAAVLGSTSTGSMPWQISVASGTGNGLIDTNRGGVNNGSGARTMAFVNTAFSNCAYTATLGVKDSGIEFLIFRYQDINNYLFLSRESVSGHWTLWKRVAGTPTIVGSTSAVLIASGDIVEVTLNGTSVIVKVNTVTLFTQTITDMQNATAYGFGSITTFAARWDNISAVTL